MRFSPLVLVDDEEGVDLTDLVAEHVHDFVDELCVVRVLESGRVDDGDVRPRAQPLAGAEGRHLRLGPEIERMSTL